jgi:glycosyltransferase involved in cell wall biosynthesis
LTLRVSIWRFASDKFRKLQLLWANMKKVCMLLKRNRSMLEKDSRVLREAKALVDAGYGVIILIFSHEDKEDFVINGAIVKTVKIECSRKLHEYNVFSDNITKAYDTSFIKKMIRKTCSFLLNRKYMSNTLNKALSLKCDIYHCHDFETLGIGYQIKKKLPAKIIYDAHELWLGNKKYISNNIVMNMFMKLLKQINIFKEWHWIKYVDINITVSQSISEYLSSFYKIEKPRVLRNLPDKSTTTSDKNKLRLDLDIRESKKIVLFQGGLLPGRGIENLIQAFENVNDDIILIFMGFGELYGYIQKISKISSFKDKILLKDAVPPSELLNYTGGADLGVSLLENTCKNHYYASPNKVWEYISAGVPILASDFPEMRQLAVDEQMGYVVDPSSPNDICNKINSIFDKRNYEDYINKKENCIEKSISRYNWDKEKEVLVKAYESL